MPRRTTWLFWTSVALAVLLIGSGVASFRRLIAVPTLPDVAMLVVAELGAVVALFVAGRIVVLTARWMRRQPAPTDSATFEPTAFNSSSLPELVPLPGDR